MRKRYGKTGAIIRKGRVENQRKKYNNFPGDEGNSLRRRDQKGSGQVQEHQ